MNTYEFILAFIDIFIQHPIFAGIGLFVVITGMSIPFLVIPLLK